MSRVPEFQSSSQPAFGMAVAGIGERNDFGIYPGPTGAVSVRVRPSEGVASVAVAENVGDPTSAHTRFMAAQANDSFRFHYGNALESGVPALYAATTATNAAREYVRELRLPSDGMLRISLAALCMGKDGEQVIVQAGHTGISAVRMSSSDNFRGTRLLTPDQPTLPFLAKGNTEPFVDELPATPFGRYVLSTHDVNIELATRQRLGTIAGNELSRAASHLTPTMAASHLYTLAGGLINASERGAIVVADVVSR